LPIRHVERPASGEAAGALVFFHGFWGIPEEFVAYLDKLDPERRLHGFLPQAPVHVNEGRYSWDERDSPEPPESQLAVVADWLDAVPYERKVLGGWSQGGWAARLLGLGAGRPRPSGLIVLGAPYFAGERLELQHAPEVLIGHGRSDESVDVGQARRFRDDLLAAGAAVTHLETDGGHHTEDAWLLDIRKYLTRVI
jgi:predicted esterase